MPIIVQKFGGSSVADAERIHLAARRALRALRTGKQVVIVVSAMGKTTDKLVELAYQVSRRPSKREMDMLLSTGEQVSIALMAMAIHEAGQEAISLTGAQVGMLTDSMHTAARIHSIHGERIRRELDAGRVVIVAGFQGVDRDFNITTLGRGGSDTTAVALAIALEAEECQIYTDVDGVYTADPRIVPEARKLDVIAYDEMLEMAAAGAKVMHARSIELGMKYGMPIHVRSSLTDTPGTVIMNSTPGMEDVAVRGATLKRDITRVRLAGLPSDARVIAAVFEEVAKHGILVDDIIQTSEADDERVTLTFTVQSRDEGEVQAVAELIAQRLGGAKVDLRGGLARISAIGVGMRSHHGVAARMFDALAGAGVPIVNVTTSEIVISAVIPATDGDKALLAVHDAFELGDPEA